MTATVNPAVEFESSSSKERVGLPSASVIIVCYNESRYLRDCLESVVSQRYPAEFDVLLVDNGSTDGSGDLVRNHFPTVRVVSPGQNLGFAKGNNFGARFAENDILVFLNADTCVQSPHWLYNLVRPMIHEKSVGLTTSKIVLMDKPDVINTCGLDVSLTGIATCRHANRQSHEITKNEEVPAVSGGAFAIWGGLFRELNGFDQNIWIYQEDTDLSWRARLLGFRCVFVANSVVKHDYKFKLSAKKSRDIERSRYLLLFKNLAWWSLIALIPQFILTEIMTWGWSILHGPRYIAAKAAACAWPLLNLRLLWKARLETQQLRRKSDVWVLRSHSPSPVIDNVAQNALGGVASRFFAPLMAVTAALALWVISPTSENSQQNDLR